MTPNTLFPGRPDYTGPTTGYFGLLHHDRLFEWSYNVLNRIDYVRNYKPKDDQAIRLWNMIYLDIPEVNKARNDYDTAYNDWYKAHNDHDKARKDWNKAWKDLKPLILAYIHKHIPDCPWNGIELVFTTKGIQKKNEMKTGVIGSQILEGFLEEIKPISNKH